MTKSANDLNRELANIATSSFQGHSHWGGQGRISEPNKVQQFQFQTSRILIFMGVQKLYRTQISQFSQCWLQFFNNLPLDEETMKK